MKLSVRLYIGDAAILILLAAFLLLAFLSFSGIPSKDNEYVRILVDGKETATLRLCEDTDDYTAGGVHIRVSDGRAYIYASDCEDKTCTKMAGVDKNGGGSVCLPNRVALEPSEAGDVHYIIG